MRTTIRFVAAVGLLCAFFAAGCQKSYDRMENLAEVEGIGVPDPEPLPDLKTLTDAELEDCFHKVAEQRNTFYECTEEQYEACLNEIVRRGGLEWEKFLRHEFDQPMRQPPKRPGGDHPKDLELLTALRRVQKKRDPLHIEGVPEILECTFPDMPVVPVKITNVDAERAAVGFQSGGDYRSGRQARWRFDVHDEQGKHVPVKDPPCPWDIGGLCAWRKLERGRSWETRLSMSNFLDVPCDGVYTMCVQYHNSLRISLRDDVSALIVSWSDPVTLIVHPRIIELSHGEATAATKLIDRLDQEGPVKLVIGPASVPEGAVPDTPPAKLLALGWKAVPALIDALKDEGLMPGRRAWILGLLFCLTGRNDPRQPGGVLADYEYTYREWAILGNLAGQEPSGSLGASGYGSRKGGVIDEEKQKTFAQRWFGFRNSLKIEWTDEVH